MATPKQAFFPGTEAAMGSYSPAIGVGDMVFVAGQGPVDLDSRTFRTGTIEEETELTINNIKRVLESAGCTIDDVVKSTVHLANINDFDRFNAVYAKHFKKPYPVRTTVQSVLGKISVEIDVIAIRGCGKGATAMGL